MIYTITLNPSIDYTVTVEDLALGELNKIKEEFKFPGGKGINVSRILTRLETENTALGFIGGFTGDFIEKSLSNEGINQNFTKIAADTRINIKLKAQTETEINGQGPEISLAEQLDLKAKLAAATTGDIVIFSGSQPPSLAADFYTELIEIVQKNGAQFVIDTTGQSLLAALPYQPLLIKPNHHELGELFNVTLNSLSEIMPYGQKLLDLGAQNALVSMGKDGALLFTKAGVYQAPPLEGTLINSVGAGDSMIAGFTSQLSGSAVNLLKAFSYGVAAGSSTAFSRDLATADKIHGMEKNVIINHMV